MKTNADKGIDSNTVPIRNIDFGSNKPIVREATTFWEFVWECFEDLTLRVLIIAAIVSLVVGTLEDPEQGWLEGVAILIAILIVVLVTSINNYVKELKFRKLSEESQERNVTVIRDGKERLVSVFELCVGDIAKIGIGDVMPVDALVLWSQGLLADESSMTGESDHVKKSFDKAPFLLSGSQIADGAALAVVLAVGENSYLGKNLASIMGEEEDETPLQKKLNYIAEFIGKIGLAMALLTFLVLLGYQIYDIVGNGWTSKNLDGIVKGFIVAVTIVVVAVPEGLPLAVTLSLAFSVNEMKKLNNLVRHLDASETMGQATNICTDKTGTLTENVMKVVAMCIGKDALYEDTKKNDIDQEVIDYLGYHFCHNTAASFGINEGKEVFTGSRTEIALLKVAREWGFDYEKIRSKDKIRLQIPFNSSLKRMYTVAEENGKLYVFIKGASEVIVDMCSKHISKGGHTHDLDHNEKETIKSEVISNYANRAYRTLGIAYKIVRKGDAAKFFKDDGSPNFEALERKMILVGVFGIQDPVRAGVPNAVRTCQNAGITVRMVTGDNPETAVAIARNCGIIDKNYKHAADDDTVMTGQEFRSRVGDELVPSKDNPKEKVVQNLQAFKQIVTKLRVLARSSPQDKLILVTGLKQLNEVVAVTGDGSNDAPALKKSNVGFSMHIAGTQLAQEASDIILLDDNFASIVTAVLWGRNIYDCISKFIQFQLTVNIVALAMSFVGAVFLEVAPITAIQMLWVNLIMDTFAALALATEPPNDSLLERKPVKHDDSLLTADMFKTIIGQSIYQLVWLIFILFFINRFESGFFHDLYNFVEECNKVETTDANGVTTSSEVCDFVPPKYKFTLFFQTFVMMQVFNEINCRKLKSSELNVFSGFCNNSLFILIIIFTIVVQVCIIQFGGAFFQCSPLPWQQHVFCLCVGLGALVFGVIFRLVPVSLFGCLNVKAEEKVQAGGFTEMVRKKTTRRNPVHTKK